MNRRQRKKLSIGEFKETILWTEVEFQIDPTYQEEALDEFLRELEHEGMLCGGGFGNPVQVSVQLCTCGALYNEGNWSVLGLRRMKHKRCRTYMNELHAAKVKRLLEKHFGPIKKIVKWDLVDSNWGRGGYPNNWDWDEEVK